MYRRTDNEGVELIQIGSYTRYWLQDGYLVRAEYPTGMKYFFDHKNYKVYAEDGNPRELVDEAGEFSFFEFFYHLILRETHNTC